MKRKILPLFVLFWVLGHIQFMAQPPKGQFSPQDFVKHLESFIVREACLTPAEATAFFPIFHELHDKQRDYYNLIKEINKLKIESAELEDVYYKKMCKAVPARKVHEAMQAEDRFHRRMLRKFSNRPDRSKQK